MTTPDMDATAYAALRNQWWLGLALAWIVLWWIVLDYRYGATMAAIVECDPNESGIGTAIGDLLGTRDCGEDARATASNDFAVAMTGRVLLVVLLFFPARFFARLHLRLQEQTQARASAASLARAEAASAARLAESHTAAASAHRQTARSDILHKLGAVSDFLRLLADEQDAGRASTIRLSATQKLRDVTAKHTLDELSSFIRADIAISLAVPLVLDALRDARLDTSPEAKILAEAMNRAVV